MQRSNNHESSEQGGGRKRKLVISDIESPAITDDNSDQSVEHQPKRDSRRRVQVVVPASGRKAFFASSPQVADDSTAGSGSSSHRGPALGPRAAATNWNTLHGAEQTFQSTQVSSEKAGRGRRRRRPIDDFTPALNGPEKGISVHYIILHVDRLYKHQQ